METIKDWKSFKDIKDWLPILSIVIIGFAYYNLANYYNNFDILIHQYLDVSEIILLSLSDILTNALLFVCPLLLFRYITTNYNVPFIDKITDKILTIQDTDISLLIKEGDEIVNKWSDESHKSLPDVKTLSALKSIALSLMKKYKRKAITIVNRASWITLFITILTIVCAIPMAKSLTQYFDVNVESSKWSTISFDFLCFFLINSIMSIMSLVFSLFKDRNKSPLTFLPIAFLIVLILGYFHIRNQLRYSYTLFGFPKYHCSVVRQDGKTIKSNIDTLAFVGITKNYVFYYNLMKREQVIIPMAQVVTLEVKELREGL